MKLNDKVYDVLKWVAIVGLDAFAVAIPALFNVWGWPYGDKIASTLQIIGVLIGTLLGISCANYNSEDNHEAE